MNTHLMDFLSTLPGLNGPEKLEIAGLLNVESFPKGELILKEGMYSDKCYFVLKGCIRQYRLVDGVEKTTGFYTEHQAVVCFNTYGQQEPSKFYLVGNEDTWAIVGSPSDEQDMYQRFPKLLEVTRAMMEQDFGRTQEEFSSFMTSTPEERYLDLLKNRPDLLQRAPQHQIASYLGVTPESLSRIRKRIAERA